MSVCIGRISFDDFFKCFPLFFHALVLWIVSFVVFDYEDIEGIDERLHFFTRRLLDSIPIHMSL